MRRAEIAGVGKFGIRQLLLQGRVALAAEALRRRRHPRRAFMLGMALDAAARRNVERLLEGELDLAPAGEVRPCARQAERIGMIVDAGVAVLAGGIAHRLEGFDVNAVALRQADALKAASLD